MCPTVCVVVLFEVRFLNEVVVILPESPHVSISRSPSERTCNKHILDIAKVAHILIAAAVVRHVEGEGGGRVVWVGFGEAGKRIVMRSCLKSIPRRARGVGKCC